MASGYSNVVARRAIDEISECCGQVNAMIAKMEAMDDSFEYADSLGCLKDSKKILGWKIMGLNHRTEDTEGEIKTFEGHLDIMDAAINSE
uniref:Uncharacterized protein n=1 Tax=Tanacetum cinerariifolium TaxID=118510 RepID=A0A6L2M112_TANCI|nr:hypothetical protein [Tanacetum cinerariifolium]